MCHDLDLSAYSLAVTIADYKFEIPFENLLGQTTVFSTKVDCDLYIVQTYDNVDNVIELGDPFFSAFMPVFDADQDLLGLALNALAVEGSSVTYIGPTPTENEEILDEMMTIQ